MRKRNLLFLLPITVLILLGASGNIRWSQLRSGDRHGTGAYGQSSDGTGASGNCAEFDANGNVTDAGAPCGAGTSGPIALEDGSTATTQSQGDGSTKVATTAYVDTGLSAAVSACREAGQYTVPYSDPAFTAATTTPSKTLYTLGSATQRICGITIDPGVAFAGTGITTMTCTVGSATGGNSAIYAAPYNVMQTTASYSIGGFRAPKDLADSSLAVNLNCTSNVNVGNGATTVLSAGSITVTVFVVTP